MGVVNKKKTFECAKKLSYIFLIKMSKAHPPELKKYMDKKIHLKINGGRAVEGILRGFDPFMNLVLDEATEITKTQDRNFIGMVVLRGNSVVMLEAKDRL